MCAGILDTPLVALLISKVLSALNLPSQINLIFCEKSQIKTKKPDNKKIKESFIFYSIEVKRLSLMLKQ